MDKFNAWVAIIVGVLWILPLLTVNLDKIGMWIVALLVLIAGIKGLMA